MAKETVTVIDNQTGRRVDLDILTPTSGPKTIDIRPLSRALGYFTYDPGFMSTASCASGLTYLEGERGVLQYRGYPIEQLARHSTFMEVCYLLLYGELPQRADLDGFVDIITNHTMINESLLRFFSGFHHNAHPMAIMVGVVGRCRRSITTRWTSITRGTARSSRTA